MQRIPSRALIGRGAILSAALTVLVLAAIASALTMNQDTPALMSSNSECLLGTYTAEKSAVVNDPITGTKQEVLVSVTLNVTRVKEGEFLVTASTTLTPQSSGKVTIMFTPPLTDMVVSTDAGTFRWSQGKYFIQAIISKELPVTSKIEMKVKGECVKAVTIEVRPLKTTIVFGTGYPAEAPPQNTRVVGGETAGYVIVVSKNGSLRIFQLKKPVEGMMLEGYVTRNITIPCNMVVGGILINSITVKVHVPENLSEERLETALQPLLAACTGNLSGLKGVAVVYSGINLNEVLKSIYASARFSYASSIPPTVTTTKLTVVSVATVTVTTTATTTYVRGTSTSHTYLTVPTTASIQTSSRTGTGTLSETAASATSTSLQPMTSSRATAAVIALGIALVAGMIAYLIIVRRT